MVLGKLSFPTYYQCCTEFSKTQQSRDVLYSYVARPARIKGCPFAQRRAPWCVTLPSRASRQKMAGVPQIPDAGGMRCLPFHHINSASVLGLLFSHCLSEYEPTSSRSLPSSDEIARPAGWSAAATCGPNGLFNLPANAPFSHLFSMEEA